jgi:hypothetical protein
MRWSRILTCLAALTVLCACGGGSSITSTAPSSPSPSQTPNPCQAGGDSATPGLPLVEVKPTSAAAPYSITKTVTLACYTILSVTLQGSANAAFGPSARCVLTQDGSASGRLDSGDPVNAFFTLGQGQVVCTVHLYTPQQKTIPMCGIGVLYLTGQASLVAACNSNHVFKVAVHSGSVLVRFPQESKHVLAGYVLTFNFITREANKPRPYTFPAADLAIFADQALAMRP